MTDAGGSRRDHVVFTWVVGSGGAVLGLAAGWLAGIIWADATTDPSESFEDLGRFITAVAFGVVFGPMVAVYVALKIAGAARPLLAAITFVVVAGALIALLSGAGAVLLPVDFEGWIGPTLVGLASTLGAAYAARAVAGPRR